MRISGNLVSNVVEVEQIATRGLTTEAPREMVQSA